MLLAALLSLATVSASDLDISTDGAELIAYHNYPVEKHYVTTDDGYTIQLLRIPKGRDERGIKGCSVRPVVFFMHGLFSSCDQFILNLPSQSPAFIFADAGFDVWLGNIRGTKYGTNHTHLKTSDTRFWNYSLYEHSHFDLRQEVEYVLGETKQESLFYIGHSQGTTIMLQRLAEADPKWQKKIRAFFALAPTGGFFKPFFPYNVLEFKPLQVVIQKLLEGDLGIYPITIPPFITDFLARLCSLKILTHYCFLVTELGGGPENLGQINETRIPFYLKRFPCTTSTLNLLSWTQAFKYHELRRLDMGRKKNVQVYGQPEPPSFKYSNIVADTFIYFSKDDMIADERDARDIILKHYGPGLRESFDLNHFSHIDFTVGLRATDEVYKPIIEIIYGSIQKNGCSV